MGEHRTTNEQNAGHDGTGAWSAVLDAAAAPVVLLDRSGQILRVNQSFAEAVGGSPEELEGCELWELVEAEHVENVKQLLGSKTPLARPCALQLRLLSGNDHRFPLLWSFTPLSGDLASGGLALGVGFDLDGTPVPALRPATFEPTTKPELPQGDTDAAPSPSATSTLSAFDGDVPDSDAIAIARLIRPLVEISSHIICVLEPEGVIVWASPSVQRVLGLDPEKLRGTNALDLVHPDDVEAVTPIIERGLEHPGTTEQVECRVRHTDGSWRYVDARGVAHSEGGVARVVVNLIDVSERKASERALAESEERFRSAFEHTAIGKVVWSADGRIVRANRAVCDILGYEEKEMLALLWREQVHPDDEEALAEELGALFAGESPSVQLVVRVRHRDGPWIRGRATLAAMRDASGRVQHVIGELEDITEQLRAEEDRRTRARRLERQQAAIVAMATHQAVAEGDREAAFQAITEATAAALEAERVGVWMFSDDRDELQCIDLFESSAGRHSSGLSFRADSFPDYFQALEVGRVVDADDARHDPRTAQFTDEYLEPNAISSRLDAPIRVGGEIVGVVCHEQVGEPRLWQADEIKFAGEVADQIAHAMASAQRKRAERRLQISEERFRSIVNASPMGLLMYRLEEDGRLVFAGANPAADAILKVDSQRFIGKTLEEAFPALAETEIPARYRRAAADGEPWHIEQIEYEDELIRGAYEVHAFQTAPGMVTVMFLEITHRKRAEEALRESEERYRLLFERNLAAVYRSTLDGRILDCNDAFAAIVGCGSRSEAMSRSASDFYVTRADRERLLKTLRSSGGLRNHEMVLRRTDGQRVWVLANMSMANDSKGKPTIIEGTMIDITQRKKAADRLLLQSTALEAAANAIVITDRSGTIQWVNQAFTRLTGYAASEAIGESLWILKSGREEGALYEEPWRAVAAGQVWRGELVNRRKDGRLYTEELTITPVRGTDGDITNLVAVQQDISERKRMEEQLLQAQKMEAVGRLAGGVAHDFNNLLQAMLGVTELLRQPDLQSEDSAEKLQELEELVRRGSQLTRQLLLFSRRDTARKEELDLNELVRGTVKLLHRLLRENIELVFEPAHGELPLLADRGQIEQVVMNLAVNACDAMPHGGRLRLVTGLVAGSAWLEVSDTGEGIPEEIRDQLFEPFFTTKERGKGTGLGLSVVHGIVTRLGGRIDLDSKVGEGTSIRVTFPAIAAAGRVPRRVAPRQEVSGGDGERVLVVEDDPAVRDSLGEILGVLGYRVTAIGSCEEATNLTDGPEFDLLLSDFVLPDGSGTEIASELRQRWPGLGVIVMSGYAQDDSVGMEAARGNLHFLQKPFSAQTLSDVVRSVLANGAAKQEEPALE